MNSLIVYTSVLVNVPVQGGKYTGMTTNECIPKHVHSFRNCFDACLKESFTEVARLLR